MADIPPKLVDWLLRRSLPPGPAGDSIRGDLLEELLASGNRPAAQAPLHGTRGVDRPQIRFAPRAWDAARRYATWEGRDGDDS